MEDTLLHFVKDHDDRKSLYSISSEVQSGTGSACNATWRGWGEHHLCQQNKGQGQTPGSSTPPVQVGIKSAPRQIPTAGETGWRRPRQDPQMAKSSWPQGRNWGLYHRSSRSKPSNTLAPTKHLQEAWSGPKCRLDGPFDETIDHLVSGCPELAKTEHIHRYNKAAAHMHWKICKEFGIEVKEWWYEQEPEAVTENDSVTILWDTPIHTDRTIAANRLDIVLKNKKD